MASFAGCLLLTYFDAWHARWVFNGMYRTRLFGPMVSPEGQQLATHHVFGHHGHGGVPGNDRGNHEQPTTYNEEGIVSGPPSGRSEAGTEGKKRQNCTYRPITRAATMAPGIRKAR